MRSVAAALCLCLSAVLGCGGSKAPDAAPRLRFMVIPKAIDLPVFNYARIGAERQAKQYGNVDVIWTGPTSADQLKQKEILESAITQRVDGIAISTLNGDFLTETIDKAIDAGIPVITWDSDAPKSRRIAFYGVDDFAGGRALGEHAVKALNGRGKVAIITSLGATNLQRRLDGMKAALATAPGIQIVEVFDIKEDTVRCAELIATGSARYPDLAAWLATGGWPVFTRNATTAIDPAKTKLFAFDTIQPALDLLREGRVEVLIGQKYFGWGSESVKLLYGIKQGQLPASRIIDSGLDVVTRANLDAYILAWKKMESGS
ncbi:MAG TPA: substrate-binding domain-containing protein [Vicinamibacterales bacterium]|nr:substrate-binding domain-containing protein [Vicinamibacterales bacterium]